MNIIPLYCVKLVNHIKLRGQAMLLLLAPLAALTWLAALTCLFKSADLSVGYSSTGHSLAGYSLVGSNAVTNDSESVLGAWGESPLHLRHKSIFPPENILIIAVGNSLIKA